MKRILNSVKNVLRNLQERVLNIAICVDQLGLSLITLGSSKPDETMSSAAYRLELRGAFWGKFWRPIIDGIFRALFGQKDHCQDAYNAEMRRLHLPSEFRK